jgi:hypothetical protein
VGIDVRVERIGLVVRVSHWPDGSRAEDYITSCNLLAVRHEDIWSARGVLDAFGNRLAHRDGKAKGRVLYLKQYRLGRGHMVTSGLAYHVEPQGDLLQVTHFAVADSMLKTDVLPAIAKLLLCAQRIALVAPLNHGHLQWICRNSDQVSMAERIYDFKRIARLPHGDVLMERPPV